MNTGHRKGWPIGTLCSLLGYSRQALYQKKKEKERGALEHELIIQQVLSIRSRQPRVGTRKLLKMLHGFLSEHQIKIGRDALFDLLGQRKLLVTKRRRRRPRTTFSDHWQNQYLNLVKGLSVTSANTVWVSDITYLTLSDKFVYLSLITDAYSHKIIGYHVSENLQTEGCLEALKMALKTLPKDFDLIHHSDRGCQYCSIEYVSLLQNHGIAISTTQKSDPRENAIAERVNGILKDELLKPVYSTTHEVMDAVKEAINIYNNERLHLSVDMLTPSCAHRLRGQLPKHWKNYYLKEKEVSMT